MAARRCLLLVTGAGKASMLAHVMEGPVTPMIPGSALQEHPNCWVATDRAASTQLALSTMDHPECVWLTRDMS